MEGVRNKKTGDDKYVAYVETRIKAGYYNSDEFCREVADVILDSDTFWCKESQSKAYRE